MLEDIDAGRARFDSLREIFLGWWPMDYVLEMVPLEARMKELAACLNTKLIIARTPQPPGVQRLKRALSRRGSD